MRDDCFRPATFSTTILMGCRGALVGGRRATSAHVGTAEIGDAWSHGFRNPFAVMDTVLESISKPIPPEPGTRFKVYKMVPVEYEVTEDADGSIHYNVVNEE